MWLMEMEGIVPVPVPGVSQGFPSSQGPLLPYRGRVRS